MGDLNSWVSDKLHELVGISDRSIAEFMVGLCKKSKSPSEFVEKIRDTGTIDVDDKVLPRFTHISLGTQSKHFTSHINCHASPNSLNQYSLNFIINI